MNTPFIFFGTPDLAVYVLEELEKTGVFPLAVITAPDRPAGRKMALTPPPVKVWAQKHGIPVLQPEKLNASFLKELASFEAELGIVAAYGKMIPQEVIDAFPHGILNVHPSLLPQYRGPSPVVSALLSGDKETGVSIMKLDAQMDHGPILSQERVDITHIPKASILSEQLFRMGGKMLSRIIPQWVAGSIDAIPQNDSTATYCQKIIKKDGLLDLSDDPEKNLRKIRAFDIWPRAYTFITHKDRAIRIIITEAHIDQGKLIIDRVIPEGKKEMSWSDFQGTLS